MSDATYEGNPCKYGHRGLRYKSNYGCVECIRLRTAKHRPKAPKRRPAGSAKSKDRVTFHLHIPTAQFDELAEDYMASSFSGTFSAYLCHRLRGNL